MDVPLSNWFHCLDVVPIVLGTKHPSVLWGHIWWHWKERAKNVVMHYNSATTRVIDWYKIFFCWVTLGTVSKSKNFSTATHILGDFYLLRQIYIANKHTNMLLGLQFQRCPLSKTLQQCDRAFDEWNQVEIHPKSKSWKRYWLETLFQYPMHYVGQTVCCNVLKRKGISFYIRKLATLL